MDRQLDPGAGAVLGKILAKQGIGLHTAKRAERWDATGLHLDDGELLRCDGVVVAAGAAPETGLAERAGIAVNNGIVVDDRLRTNRSNIYAIGDCARHPGTPGGLVQPGWEQAAVLADLLTDTNPAARYRGTPSVTRLKAAGIELAAMGDRDGPDDAEVLTFADSTRGRYARLTLTADRIVGAIMLGLPDAAATVTQLFDRGAVAPSDRLALLLGRALPAESSPVSAPFRLPAHAVICRCNTVTKRQLVTAWETGARDVDALAMATRATTGCGTCRDAVCGIREWLAGADPATETERVAS
jgi:assimilatory nitrate reductase electron transfer subunit